MVFGNPDAVLKAVCLCRPRCARVDMHGILLRVDHHIDRQQQCSIIMLPARNCLLVLLDDLSGVVILDYLPRIVDQMRRQI